MRSTLLHSSRVYGVAAQRQWIGSRRMSTVVVVTDSTASLPPELVERHGIRVVPLYVVFGGDRPVPENEITDYPAFFEELRSAEKLPTTSQPSVGDFNAAFEPLLAEGHEIVSVHISGGLSGTPEAARQAKEGLERDGGGGERIEVVDSTTAAGGLGFMALAAAHAARGGANASRGGRARGRGPQGAEDVVRGRHARVPQARRAHRGGERVDRLDAQGQADPHRRERDDARRARAHLAGPFERLVDYGRQRHESGADAWSAQHINAPDQCAAAGGARHRGLRPPAHHLVSEIGPVLAAHTGPGLLGIGAIPTHFVE